MHRGISLATLLLVLAAGVAGAGGSNYGIAPGARPNLEGKIHEWAVPTPKFARDPAPGPDGNIYISVMNGIRKMAVDAQGRLWYMGSHSGRLGMIE